MLNYWELTVAGLLIVAVILLAIGYYEIVARTYHEQRTGDNLGRPRSRGG